MIFLLQMEKDNKNLPRIDKKIVEAIKQYKQSLEANITWHDSFKRVLTGDHCLAHHFGSGIEVELKQETLKNLGKLAQADPKFEEIMSAIKAGFHFKFDGDVNFKVNPDILKIIPKFGDILAESLYDVGKVKEAFELKFDLDKIDQSSIDPDDMSSFQGMKTVESFTEICRYIDQQASLTVVMEDAGQAKIEVDGADFNLILRVAILLYTHEEIKEQIEDSGWKKVGGDEQAED